MADGYLNFDTRIDSSGFKKGLSGLKSLAEKGLGGIKNLAVGITKSVAATSVALGGLGAKCVSLASDLAEVQNVVDVTFGDGAEKINSWAKSMATGFGIGELQAKQFAGTMGAMVKSMGLSDEATEQMATNLTELSGDFASFYNLKPEEAFEKIRAGISGETEPLKSLGVNMSVANLEAYALSQGISKTYDKMTQAEQATLRYSYLMSVSADAQGDFARTSDSLANQLRILKLNFTDLGSTIGTTLIPVAQEAVGYINDMVSELKKAFETGGFNGLANSLGAMLADSFTKIAEYAPKLIDMGANIINSLVKGISDNSEKILNAAANIGRSIINGIEKIAPNLITVGGKIFDYVCNGLNDNMSAIVEKGLDIVDLLMKGVKSALPKVASVGITLIKELGSGIKEHIPGLMESAAEIVVSLTEFICDNLDVITQCAIDIIEGLGKGLIKAAEKLVLAAPEIMDKLCDGLVKSVARLGRAVTEIGKYICDGLKDFDWEKNGEVVMQGLEKGLKSGMDSLGFFNGSTFGSEMGDAVYRYVTGKSEPSTHYSSTFKEHAGNGKGFESKVDLSKNSIADFNKLADNAEPRAEEYQKKMEDALNETGDNLEDAMKDNFDSLAGIAEDETKKIADTEYALLYKQSDETIALQKKLQQQENAEYERTLQEKEKIGISSVAKSYKKMYDAEKKAITDKENRISKLEEKMAAQAMLVRNAQAMAEVDDSYKELTEAKLKEIAAMSETTKDLELKELMDGKKTLLAEELKLVADKNAAVMELQEQQLNDEKTIQEQLLSNFQSTYANLVNEYENAYNTIANKQETLSNKLKAFGDLMDTLKVTEKDANGNDVEKQYFRLGDIQDDISQLRTLKDNMDALLQRGVDKSFIDEYLNANSVQDSMDFFQILNMQSEESLKNYMDSWKEKQTLANEISQGFYQSEFDDLKQNFTDKVKDELGVMPEEAEKAGQNTALSLAQGMISGIDTVKGAVQELVAQMKGAVLGESASISAQLATTSSITQNVQTKDNATNNTLGAIYGAIKEAVNTKTPIVIEMDGKAVGEGSADGTLREFERRGIVIAN